jgi:hypothetical protein
MKPAANENKKVNTNLKTPFSKNKKAKAKIKAMPTDKAIAGCRHTESSGKFTESQEPKNFLTHEKEI